MSSALAHAASDETFDVALGAIGAALQLDEDRCKFYTQLVLAALSDAARARLEEMMRLGNWPEPTDLEKRILARGEAIEEARGEARALLTILRARGIDVPDALRDRVLACADVEVLEEWVARAASAMNAADVFGTDP